MTIAAARTAEQIEIPPPRPRVEVETLAGTWLKTNEGLNWIRRVDVDTSGDDLYVRIFGDEPSAPRDWGRVQAHRLYAGSIRGGNARAGAFIASYEIDGMNIEVEANLNLGLLVVATFVRFLRPTGKSDCFTREFFFRAGEAE